ncbi:uncharacterized protein LTR77_006701 [Saxophila tyrrhenica]|uniref:Cytochrome P450 n=1 Tax=Saxophila tyrrhenica TaxID=1690608 RepID=A0AAV9P8H5_9PEZI|nr:hypothetical protein LTR77_006701 [Saxophila tyrrhenica]
MLAVLWLLGLLLSLILYTVYHISIAHSRPSGAELPPGPRGLPLIGNLLQIPPKHSWLKFYEWSQQYGPLYRLSVMGRNQVIVSTEKVANGLLRERGNIYSSREQLPMAAKLMSRDLRPLLLPYGERWRRGRKLMHAMTMPSAATSYQPLQTSESEHLLVDLLRQPDQYEFLLERYAGAVIMRLAYDKSYEGNEDDVRKALQVVHTVERVASPGAYLVDTFPFLMYLPDFLAPFKREAKALHQFELTFFRSMLADVRERLSVNACGPCFARSFLERQDSWSLSMDEGAYVLGTLFEAGSGTTAAAMMSFILAMLHHPAWQTAIQCEVDDICGADGRLPNFADVPQLPTVRAVIKEVLRWRPVTAGGVPHELERDDVYDGVFLPKGTNVHANQWAIHRDPALYPDPDTFNPARWLDEKYPTYRTPLDRYPNLQNSSAFGFGRRICPGMNIAENSLHLLTARLAWAVDVRKKPGVDVPWYNYTEGFNVQPKPFQFELIARSADKRRIVEQTWQQSLARGPGR